MINLIKQITAMFVPAIDPSEMTFTKQTEQKKTDTIIVEPAPAIITTDCNTGC